MHRSGTCSVVLSGVMFAFVLIAIVPPTSGRGAAAGGSGVAPGAGLGRRVRGISRQHCRQRDGDALPRLCGVVVQKREQRADSERALMRLRGGADVIRCRFQVRIETESMEEVLLLGSSRAFGNWNTSSAVVLQHIPFGDWWWGEVFVPVGDTVQFKFAIRDATGKITWEPIMDRSATIPDAVFHSLYFRFGEAGVVAPHMQIAPQLLRAFCRILSRKNGRNKTSLLLPEGDTAVAIAGARDGVQEPRDEKPQPRTTSREAHPVTPLHGSGSPGGPGATPTVDFSSKWAGRALVSTPVAAPPATALPAGSAAVLSAVAVTATTAYVAQAAAPMLVAQSLAAIARARLRVMTRPPPQLTSLSPSRFGRDFLVETLEAAQRKLKQGFSAGGARISRS
jgi:hypothetical protein